jgi:hypothetical protein
MQKGEPQKNGMMGESTVFKILTDRGFNPRWEALTGSGPDFILENGKTIDVKLATRRSKTSNYVFNLHHHSIAQDGIDFFICIANSKDENLIFVFPATLISGKTLSISQYQLDRGRYDFFLNNFDLLAIDKK